MTHDSQFYMLSIPFSIAEHSSPSAIGFSPSKNLFIYTYTFHFKLIIIFIRFSEFSKPCNCQPNQQCMELEIINAEREKRQ